MRDDSESLGADIPLITLDEDTPRAKGSVDKCLPIAQALPRGVRHA